jgi:hypothetical protein
MDWTMCPLLRICELRSMQEEVRVASPRTRRRRCLGGPRRPRAAAAADHPRQQVAQHAEAPRSCEPVALAVQGLLAPVTLRTIGPGYRCEHQDQGDEERRLVMRTALPGDLHLKEDGGQDRSHPRRTQFRSPARR